ncbi:hypothetical protein PFISCL1PPCAC_4393, partial [Pristionchus fissidentatus]
QPFHSDFLLRFNEDVVELNRNDKSNMVKFACAFSILMTELSGSIIGSESNANTVHKQLFNSMEGIKAEPQDEEPEFHTMPNDALLRSDVNAKEVKVELEEIPLGLVKQENTVDAPFREASMDDIQPGPSATVYADYKAEVAKLQQEKAKRTEWLRAEMRLQLHPMRIVPARCPAPATKRTRELPRIVPAKKPLAARIERDPAAHLITPYRICDSAAPRTPCRFCTTSDLKLDDLASHEELVHNALWMSSARKCPVDECDYRVTMPKARSHHVKTVHLTSASARRHTYMLPQNTRCPYCRCYVVNVAHFINHMNAHRENWTNKALVFVCNGCDVKSARMFQMIEHWNESGCTQGLRFDYEAAGKAPDLCRIHPAAAAAHDRPLTLAAGAARLLQKKNEKQGLIKRIKTE